MSQETASPLKYNQLISQSQSDVESQEVQFITEEARLTIDSDILATQREIAIQKRAVNAAKSARQFNSQAILTSQKKLEGLEEGLKRLQDLKEELF